jgi:hypothetical protein
MISIKFSSLFNPQTVQEGLLTRTQSFEGGIKNQQRDMRLNKNKKNAAHE